MGALRQKCTIGPPKMCDSCYHSNRAHRLEKLLKKLRLELITAVAARRKVEAHLKMRKPPKPIEEPREKEDVVEERDPEVADLVEQFTKRGG